MPPPAVYGKGKAIARWDLHQRWHELLYMPGKNPASQGKVKAVAPYFSAVVCCAVSIVRMLRSARAVMAERFQ